MTSAGRALREHAVVASGVTGIDDAMPEQNAEVLEVNRVISEALGVLTQTDLRSETSRERLARFSAAFRRTESTAAGRALRFRGNSAPRFAKGALSSRSFNLPRSVMWDVHGRVAARTSQCGH